MDKGALRAVPRSEGRPPLADPASDVRKDSAIDQAGLLEIVGIASLRLGDYDEAVKAFSDAMGLADDSHSSRYLRGIAFYKTASFEQAARDLDHYLAAVEDPTDMFWADHAAAKGKVGEFDAGTKSIERALARHPYDIDAREEAGYQYMKWGRNDVSIEHFARAIDVYTMVLPYLEGDEQDEYEENRTALKREVSKLDKTFGFQAYFSKTDYDLGSDPAFSSIDGALPSQAGLEASWRPPVIGFRDDRILEVFGRVLANFEDESWSFDDDSYQGGVGVRAKPFKAWNVVAGFERLFAIGDNAEDNWLLRALGSYDFGEAPAEKWEWALKGRAFGEVGYFFEDPARWYYYLDGRVGPSVAWSRRLVFNVPELMGVRRWESDTEAGLDNYWLAGIGVTVRWFEKERDYTIGRWYADLFVHYTFGWFDEVPDGLDDESFDGIVFGVNVVK